MNDIFEWSIIILEGSVEVNNFPGAVRGPIARQRDVMLFRAMRGPLIHRVARLPHVKLIARKLCSSSKAEAKEATEAVGKKAWWQTAEFWGAAGAGIRSSVFFAQ